MSLRELCTWTPAAFGCQNSGRASRLLEKAPSRWPGWRPWPRCHGARPWPPSPLEAKPGQGSRAQTCSEPSRRGGLQGRAHAASSRLRMGRLRPRHGAPGGEQALGLHRPVLLCEQAPHIRLFRDMYRVCSTLPAAGCSPSSSPCRLTAPLVPSPGAVGRPLNQSHHLSAK